MELVRHISVISECGIFIGRDGKVVARRKAEIGEHGQLSWSRTPESSSGVGASSESGW